MLMGELVYLFRAQRNVYAGRSSKESNSVCVNENGVLALLMNKMLRSAFLPLTANEMLAQLSASNCLWPHKQSALPSKSLLESVYVQKGGFQWFSLKNTW